MNPGWMRSIVAALGLLVAGAAQAQVSEPDAEALMRASGLWQQLAHAAPAMRSGLTQSLQVPGATVSEDTRQKLLAAAETAFVPERMQAVARKSLAERLRTVHLPALKTWYATPEGRRITEAEVADSAREVDTEADVKEGLALLQAAPVPRRQLILRVAEVTRSGQTGADLMVNLAVGMQLGLARVTPGAAVPDERTLRAPLEEQRAQLQRSFMGIAVAGFARAYKGLPDITLDRYVDFLASAAGEHYTDLGLAAMEAAMLDGLGALGRR